MRHTVSVGVFALGLVSMVGVAHADHNSMWREGWSSMHNGVHDTRAKTLEDDTDSIVDFVHMSSGAKSANPSISDTNTAGDSRSHGGTRGGRS